MCKAFLSFNAFLPFEDTYASNGKVWHKNSEDLHIACTGYGERQVKFFDAISYDVKGVILAEQYIVGWGIMII